MEFILQHLERRVFVCVHHKSLFCKQTAEKISWQQQSFFYTSGDTLAEFLALLLIVKHDLSLLVLPKKCKQIAALLKSILMKILGLSVMVFGADFWKKVNKLVLSKLLFRLLLLMYFVHNGQFSVIGHLVSILQIDSQWDLLVATRKSSFLITEESNHKII